MNDKDIINSVNLYANTNFPYLVLNVIGEDRIMKHRRKNRILQW